jgi:glutamate--cysteine ligase
MPCILRGEAQIPIAQYGTSNAGRMKHVYRVGLGYRYGRIMQVIAGVHFNYSVPESFWPMYAELVGQQGSLRGLRDQHYMGMVRNLQRHGWLIPYLFGASPAVCRSFLGGKPAPANLQAFDENTLFAPYATSLRMGDIGYQNRREEGIGVTADYNSLDRYVSSLQRAISTPAAQWEEIGVKVNGEYRQLNANLLQIENEYYNSVRPKQLLEGLEKPTHALARRGVRYVELRSLDVNAYQPVGICNTQVRFLEAFMLYCLLAESPPIDRPERHEIDNNMELVALRGREPGLTLIRDGRAVPLKGWAAELLDGVEAIAELLDGQRGSTQYRQAVLRQRDKVCDPEATPSARMLADMRSQGEGFYAFARRLSQAHQQAFAGRRLEAARQAELEGEVEDSLARQVQIEADDDQDFDSFLARYFAGL